MIGRTYMKNVRIGLAAIAALAAIAITACSAAPEDESSSSSSGGRFDVRNEAARVKCSSTAQPSAPPAGTYATTAQVLDAVKAAQCLKALPEPVATALNNEDTAGGQNRFDCSTNFNETQLRNNNYGECTLGDQNGTKLMVVYGDSRAHMWGATLEGVAAQHGWKLKVFSKGGCPVQDLNFRDDQTKTPFTECDDWHARTPAVIKALHPDLVLVTSIPWGTLADGSEPTPSQWQDGWTRTLGKLAQPGTKLAMIGSIAQWGNAQPSCLAKHQSDIQACSQAVDKVLDYGNGETNGHQALDAEKAAATGAGALYISTVPWVCASRCEPVIAGMRAFETGFHLSQHYAVYLTGALGEALQPLVS
jgi:SGNH domain (fused to AT3 domains)